MSDSYSTTPQSGGQADRSPTNNLKYAFDPTKSIIFDVEVFPGPRWCCGFLAPDGTHTTIDGDKDRLAETLNKIHRAGLTLAGYNSQFYDIPILRAILAGKDPYEVSRALVNYDGWGLPPDLRDRADCWSRIKADHIDLVARTRDGLHFPGLKRVAANLGVKHLAELPYDPEQALSDAEWEHVKQYNRKDLDATKAVLEQFTPDLHAIAALSNRYGMDLRSTHQAGIASKVLCAAYKAQHGADPSRAAPPPSVRYSPPEPVVRPRQKVAAAWFDRIVSEAFPMAVPKGGEHRKPVVPGPGAPIVIGGVELNVGAGGMHSADQPALHRTNAEYEIYETDVASFYPSMMERFDIFPRALGDAGLLEYREILAERLEIKAKVAAATAPEEAKYYKAQAAGLKIVLNSVFGQFGNPYSTLCDHEAFLGVTLSGQLLLLDLIERIDMAGAEILSVNTDGLYFKVRRGEEAWCKVLANWESDTSMTLETGPVEALLLEATNHYAVRYPGGKTKRRGNLGDTIDWKRVPNGQVVADAVVHGLLDGTLPETTIRRESRASKFVSVTRRDTGKVGVLINDATGAEESLPRLTRWYKGLGSPLRIEHRWTDDAGKSHKTTPPGATGIQLLMDLPEPGSSLGDIDRNWYVGVARARILANRDFPHLDPKWLHGISQDLHARGLAPSPHWAGKKSPKGTKKDCPSYFWEWSRYDAFGTFTGPEVGVLALDVDEPAKFRKWIEGLGSLDDCLVSYHRVDSPEAVRAGTAKGKLIFQFAVSADHPLAKVGKAALKSSIGLEVFYGHGDPAILGKHPDGPEHDYLLSDGTLGAPPDWLIEDLAERASKKVSKPRAPKEKASDGNGKPADSAAIAKYAMAALENEIAKVEAAEEGTRNDTIWRASCAIGGLIGAGALDREEAEERLIGATSLPPEEAVDVIRRGFERGMACPRDLGHVGRNGDGERPANEAVNDPHRLARLYRDDRCRHTDATLTMRYWQGEFVKWEGAYRILDIHELNSHLAQFCKREFDRANEEAIAAWEKAGKVNLKGEPVAAPQVCKVTRNLIGNVDLALGGYSLLDGRTENPAWLIEDPPFPALEVLPTRNFLVHLPGVAKGEGAAAVREPHPNFFGLHALDYDFDPAAPKPMEWLRFLGAEPITKASLVKLQLWPKDLESILCLQEWMGYLLTCDTSHQKILGLIGPRRCGKGTISRVIRALVGTPNVAYPTLGSLGTQFGLQPLVGKLVAIVADARLSGHTDLAAVVENLLSVSGEDARTVDRKHLTSLTLRLYTRFVVLANDIPKLIDASGALVGRMIILRLVASFFGMEDRKLMTYFTPELPGILLWAIAGWKRLNERGYFLQPASGQDDIDLMAALGSPVGAFVADQCEVGPEHEVAIQALFDAWKAWCVSKGREKSVGDYHTFGKNLRAAVPTITTLRKGSKAEERVRHYQGIGLATPEDGKPF